MGVGQSVRFATGGVKEVKNGRFRAYVLYGGSATEFLADRLCGRAVKWKDEWKQAECDEDCVRAWPALSEIEQAMMRGGRGVTCLHVGGKCGALNV